jgi:hypothetical protein
MSLYTELNPFFEYLTSVRKLENYLVFDMSFPNTWKVLKKYIEEDKFLNNGATEDNLLSLSFVSEYVESEIERTQNNILGIINYNLEREEKEKLLNFKINELKTIFEKENLDNLKVLKFEINAQTEKSLNNGKSGTKSKKPGISEVIADEGQA